jgi:hypothetical protein
MVRPRIGTLSQFTDTAGWPILIGLATIAYPFVWNVLPDLFLKVAWVMWLLPIVELIGLAGGIQAVRSGQRIGGVVGIVLNVIGGIITVSVILVLYEFAAYAAASDALERTR